MKHGAHYYPFGQRESGMQVIPDRFEVHGIPVRLNTASRHLAEARGLWPFKTIVVNAEFFGLDHREQYAVLWHEVGHCVHFHLEKRLLLVPVFWTRFAQRVTVEQELQADAYAKMRGYADDLARVLQQRMRGHSEYFVRARALAGA